MPISLSDYINRAHTAFPPLAGCAYPWQATTQAVALVQEWLRTLGDDYRVHNGVAIHRTATVEEGVVLKGPVVVSAGCFLAAHAYLRGGVFLDEGVTVGPGSEVKSSFLFQGAALAHFNFVGDSLVGAGANLEAGAVTANHYNEHAHKDIAVRVGGQVLRTGGQKFGALIGDGSRLGANAVTSPGTLLPPVRWSVGWNWWNRSSCRYHRPDASLPNAVKAALAPFRLKLNQVQYQLSLSIRQQLVG